MAARPRLSIVDLMPVRDGDPHTRVLADTSMEQSVLAMLRGAPASPAPDPAATARWSADERRAVDAVLGLAQVGTPAGVAGGLADLAARTGADEIMVTCQIWDTGARIAALQALAPIWHG